MDKQLLQRLHQPVDGVVDARYADLTVREYLVLEHQAHLAYLAQAFDQRRSAIQRHIDALEHHLSVPEHAA